MTGGAAEIRLRRATEPRPAKSKVLIDSVWATSGHRNRLRRYHEGPRILIEMKRLEPPVTSVASTKVNVLIEKKRQFVSSGIS